MAIEEYKPFEPTLGPHRSDLQGLQFGLKSFLQQIESCPLLDGRLLENLSFSASSNTVEHKLGRQPQGWIVVNLKQGVGAAATARLNLTAWDAKRIKITSDQAAIVSLWVF